MQRNKRYSIVLRGNVQDVGFRSRIISAARIYNLTGFPPVNDIDGSVKMICEGPEELVNKFLLDIDIREELPSGIRVEVLEKKEIPLDFPIPSRPAAFEAEELSNISRKLDIGIDSLKNMEGSLGNVQGSLKNMEGSLGNVQGSLKNMETTLSRNTGILEKNTGILEKNTGILEKNTGILEKNTGILEEMNKSLPERIARAIKEGRP